MGKLSSLNLKPLTFQESLNGMLSLIWNVIIVKKKAIYPEIALKTVASRVIIVGLMGTYLEIAHKGIWDFMQNSNLLSNFYISHVFVHLIIQ